MDGVTILSVIEKANPAEIFAVMLIAGISAGFIMGGMIALAELEPSYLAMGIAIGMIIGVLFGSILGVIAMDDSSQYKVTVSEEVNFQEFHNTYDIISQEGEIYTVKLK